jgi:uncharacterized membrane protein
VFVGVAEIAALGRTVYFADWIQRLDPLRQQYLALAGVTDPHIAERPVVLARLDARYARHPWLTRSHTILGGIFLLLAPLQFNKRIRDRYRAFHRWSGRTLLGLGTIAGITGLYFGVLVPWAGMPEAVTILLFGSFFFVAGVKAFTAIRRGDVDTHRNWMIRAMAVPLGAGSVRVVGEPIDLVLTPTGVGPEIGFVVSVWAGWLVTVGAAELWIACTRPE